MIAGECEAYDLKNHQKSKTVGLSNTTSHLNTSVVI